MNRYASTGCAIGSHGKGERRYDHMGSAYGFYEIFSVVMSEQEADAATQAQKLRDHSTVAEMFKAGEVKQARFGFEEIETGFCP